MCAFQGPIYFQRGSFPFQLNSITVPVDGLPLTTVEIAALRLDIISGPLDS
jgi:hypothetical protein